MLNSWFGDLPTYLGITIIAESTFIGLSLLNTPQTFCYLLSFRNFTFNACSLCRFIPKARKGHLMDGIFDNIPIIMILFGVLPIINSQIVEKHSKRKHKVYL